MSERYVSVRYRYKGDAIERAEALLANAAHAVEPLLRSAS